MDKTSLKKALIEVKEMENFATESAKKIMEQEFLPKIESSVRKALLEMEASEMGEASEITLDNGASVNVTVGADGKVTIQSGDGTAPAVIGTPENQIDTAMTTDTEVGTELPAAPEDVAPVVPSIDSMTPPVEDGAEEISTPEEEDELFEIVDDTEEVDDEETVEEPAVEDGAEEAPVEEPAVEDGAEEAPEMEMGGEEEGGEMEMGGEEEGGEMEMGGEESTEEKVEKISMDVEEMKSMLSQILKKISGEEAEGDVEIVDDGQGDEEGGLEMDVDSDMSGEEMGGEELGGEEVPMEEPAIDEEPTDFGAEEASEEDEIFFEFDDVLDETKNKDLEEINDTLSEIEKMEESLQQVEEEKEITMEELEETLREMLGGDSITEYGEEHPVTVKDALDNKVPGTGEEELFEIEIENANEEEMVEGDGISLANRQGQNAKPNNPHKKVRAGLEESVKAQNESKLDELKKENESLKSVVKEYKESFVTLRKQMDEVQTFNAKLAYANKVFTKGGLTNEEKTIISEKFDACKTADEAKALYNKLIKESSVTKKPNVSKIQLPKAASTNSSVEKGTLYENSETKRMKQLAGIIK